jgi:serine/threonine protein kinase
MLKYTALQKINEGGMAVIYKATDTVLNRTVAIKKLQAYLSQDEAWVRRFEQEAKIISLLNHPNIIQIYDYGRDKDNRCFIVMEFIQGKSLADYLKEKAVSIEIGVMIIYKIARVLEYAHQKKIIHRDIKPSNILIGETGIIKLTDFGISKLVEASVTPSGDVLGTPSYMSPEQLSGKEIGPPSDVFSLGVILYEILTQRHPFPGESFGEIAHKIIATDYQKPLALNSSVPQELASLTEKCLQQNATERCKIKELAQGLYLYLKNLDLENIDEEMAAWIKAPAQYNTRLKKRLVDLYLKEGVAFKKGGRFHQASLSFAKALKIDPENAQVYSHLEEIKKSTFKKGLKKRVLIGLSLVVIVLTTGILLRKNYLKSDIIKGVEHYQEVEKTILPPREKRIEEPEIISKKPLLEKKLVLKQTKIDLSQSATLTKKAPRSAEEKISPPKDKKHGWLTIYTETQGVPCWAEIYLDGEKVGETPTKKPLKLLPRKYKLVLKNPYCKEYPLTVEIKEDDRKSLQISLEKKEESKEIGK